MRNHGSPQMLGDSPAMRELREEIERVARSDAKVLITGESGAGKEVVARAIHAPAPAPNRPFVPVNCAGIPETLLESELFGHVKGSFTGAYRDKPGKLEMADNGTHVPRRNRRDDAADAGAAPAVPRDRRDSRRSARDHASGTRRTSASSRPPTATCGT